MSDDLLVGNEFNYSIVGNAGNDTLLGSLGNDAITGYGGNDTLNGNTGIDMTTGGFERDRFLFGIGTRLNKRLVGIHIIGDFARGQDKIVLDRTTYPSARKAEAQQHVPALIANLKLGKEIQICQNEQAIARLISEPQTIREILLSLAAIAQELRSS